MIRRVVQAVGFGVFSLIAVPAAAQCAPGAPAPEIWARGFQRDARVNLQIEVEIAPGKQDCLRTGLQRWNGTNGVQADAGMSNATATVIVKCCMSESSPMYRPDVVAGADFRSAQRSATQHVTEITIWTGPNWTPYTSAYGCELIQALMAHEMGHAFGLGHTPPGSLNLMQDGPGSTNLNNWTGTPDPCEIDKAQKALTARTGFLAVRDDMGCPGGGFTDNKNCCINAANFTLSWDNWKPTGHIVAPLTGSVLPTGSSGSMRIDVKDLDGHITRVGWYMNGVLMHTAYSEPWSAPYSNAAAGTYQVQAAIYDSADEYAWSNQITIVVGNYYAADTLETGGRLWPGWTLVSSGSTHYLRLETNGNLVLYTAAGVPVAASGTIGIPAYLEMEQGGNLVLRHNPSNPQVVWQTFTGSQPNINSGVRVLNTGKIAIIHPSGSVMWMYP